ncbi:MAG: transcription antitermination factor NusB [Candidatus Tumulicola sp.]
MTAREIALAVVRDVFPPADSRTPGRGAQESLDYRSRKARADARDRAFATELAYGSIKMRRALDWYLSPFLGERSKTLPAATHEIVRLAMYELAYTRADAHATVFEFVNLAKRFGHRGLANLVNAVLREFLRRLAAPPVRESFDDVDDYLGTRYSLPNWLVRQWRECFGEGVEAVCAAVNDPARLAITVDTGRASPEAVAERLSESGISTVPSALVAESLLLESGSGRVHDLETASHGAWWIQSESAAMAADVLDPHPGETILDVCSGRGNKALQIGARLRGDGRLACIERDARKAAVLRTRLESNGVAAEILVADATGEAATHPLFDRALIDAPCSGVGVVGRHPEARWKKRATDGERLAVTQRALLERTARSVREGGVLVYAVCSTDPRETTEVMQWFLSRENFVRGPVPAVYESFSTAAGDLLIPPGIAGRDGFFIARLERR